MATCGIRKLLDYVFTQSELFWLDDILPGASKHNKHEENIINLNERVRRASSNPIYKGIESQSAETTGNISVAENRSLIKVEKEISTIDETEENSSLMKNKTLDNLLPNSLGH